MIVARARRRFAQTLHNVRIAGIERTPPLRARATGLMYLSQVCHQHVRCWLVAIKSVSEAVGPGEVTVVDDGSLTESDRTLLCEQVRGLRILSAADIPHSGCPAGNTWERLLALLDLTADRYVVQVDADLVALRALPDVADAVRANRAFILSGDPGVAVTTVGQAAESARRTASDHVQSAAERLLDQLPGAGELRYVRGCAGFAGFPRGGSRTRVVVFSQFMQQSLGQRWNAWGSEQVACNFAIANSRPDPLVLPWELCPAFGWQRDIGQAALVHFIGTYRYEAGVYCPF